MPSSAVVYTCTCLAATPQLRGTSDSKMDSDHLTAVGSFSQEKVAITHCISEFNLLAMCSENEPSVQDNSHQLVFGTLNLALRGDLDLL